MENILNDKVILVTGGTGSFGNKFSEILLKKYHPKKLIIYSRDEYKQSEMAKILSPDEYPIRYFLGDVRDKDRLLRAFDGVDYIVHTAALKQVPALEYNPTEAIKTNVDGADNIVDAAISCGVKKVVALSTDKAVNPANLYGATKLVAEKVFVSANAYAGGRVKFSVVRYGNVMGSRGSIIPLYLDLKRENVGEFPVTHEKMTRFWITLDQGVELVFKALEMSEGGEIFIPEIPSMKITDLAKAIDPAYKIRFIGIRPGEKIHETLISEDEARNTKYIDGIYVILPQFNVTKELKAAYGAYPSLPEYFAYRSDINKNWLTVKDIEMMLKNFNRSIK